MPAEVSGTVQIESVSRTGEGSSVEDFGLSPIWGWHLLGTARMGEDPQGSVVNRAR
jgi:choline dehydrogenase-like flavoprotein